jgi:hypothetical protein
MVRFMGAVVERRRVLILAGSAASIAQLISEHPDVFAGDDMAEVHMVPEAPRAIEMMRGADLSELRLPRHYHQDRHRPRDQYARRGRR